MTTINRPHLTLMAKPRLVDIIERSSAEAAHWRNLTARLIATAPKVDHAPSPETTLAEARRILRGIGTDPNAGQHRGELLAELEAWKPSRRPGPLPGTNLPGPRCERGMCNQRLNEHGMCSRCQHRETRKARAAAAA